MKAELQLSDLLIAAAKQLEAEFAELRATNPHAAESGAEAEIILRKFLMDRLPRRFEVDTGIVLGANGEISRQIDLIIYDALNSPVYRRGPRVLIVPRDNVAAIIEVKSKINKQEIMDAAEKIASVKSMRVSPISELDQPVTMSPLIIANTLGCVFAYDSYTSLDALAENLAEINETHSSNEWVDLVTVLGKGNLSYGLQFPYSDHFDGQFGGPAVDDFVIMPLYVHLVKQDEPDVALNRFFLKLTSHLAFFRKRTTLDFEGILGGRGSMAMSIQAYQYNLDRKLVRAQEDHYVGKFQNPTCRVNLYQRSEQALVGQVCFWPWQDGAVITCSVRIDPMVVFGHFFRCAKQRGHIMKGGPEGLLYFSSLLRLTEAEFISFCESIHPDLISMRDPDDKELPPFKLKT